MSSHYFPAILQSLKLSGNCAKREWFKRSKNVASLYLQ